MKVVLAGDLGPAAGLGHRRRLEAIGAALGGMGHASELVEITDAPGPGRLGEADVAVVDSYLVRADASTWSAPLVVAIDELGRDLAVDLRIDPTPGAVAPARTRARRTLAGTDVALVDPGLREMPARAPAAVERVLVSFGATAAAAHAAAIAASLAVARPELRVQVALGPWVEAVAAGVERVDAPGGLASVLAAADLVVSAGGVTMLEACVLGRPTVAVAVAENQRAAVRALGAGGAVAVAELATALDTTVRLIDADSERAALGEIARATVDGRGAERVAAAIVELWDGAG